MSNSYNSFWITFMSGLQSAYASWGLAEEVNWLN
jgi:hypothetical protein